MTSENRKNLARMGFKEANNALVYTHGPVTVTHLEVVNYDWPYLKHLIDVRAAKAKYLTALYADHAASYPTRRKPRAAS